MAQTTKGKQEVLHVHCPTCQTHIIADMQGDVLQSFYEKDEEKASQKVKEVLPSQDENEDREGSSGKQTAQEDQNKTFEEESEKRTSEDDEYKLGNY